MNYPVFDDKPRSRRHFQQRGESPFQFFDTCGRNVFDIFRTLVNQWSAELPASEQPAIQSRMRKGDAQQFYATFAELIMHASFKRLGYEVLPHPPLPTTTRRPDFLVTAPSGNCAYVEVTTFGPSAAVVAETNRSNAVFEAITRAHLPAGYRLGYSLKRSGPNTPSLRKLVAEVEKWATTAKHKEEMVLECDGWKVELSLFTGFKHELPPEGVIAGSVEGARWLGGAQEIRTALESKSRSYGTLNAPFILVVTDCKDELISEVHEELTEALLGDEVIEDTMSSSGTVRTALVRRGGFWFKGGKPVHQNVSSVVLLPAPGLWQLRTKEYAPVVAHNPWGQHPLAADFFPIPSWSTKDDRWTFTDGQPLADILGLPAEWPPSRD